MGEVIRDRGVIRREWIDFYRLWDMSDSGVEEGGDGSVGGGGG